MSQTPADDDDRTVFSGREELYHPDPTCPNIRGYESRMALEKALKYDLDPCPACSDHRQQSGPQDAGATDTDTTPDSQGGTSPP